MVLNFQNVHSNNPTVGSGSSVYVDASKWGLASLDQLISFKIYINGKQNVTQRCVSIQWYSWPM